MLNKYQNFDKISEFWPNFFIMAKLISELQPNLSMQWELHLPADMCGSKANSNMASPRQGPIEEVSGDHLLSPHLEGAHKVNISIVLSSGAISMLLVSIIVYCLIKKRIVRCCEGENTAHDIAPQENNRSMALPRFLPPPTPLPTPYALTQQPLNASTQFDLESAMAQLQAQNSALLNHLAIQQQQTEGPRPSQYPMV